MTALREILKHTATAGGLRITDEARVDFRVGGQEAIYDRAHLTSMAPLPMSEPV